MKNKGELLATEIGKRCERGAVHYAIGWLRATASDILHGSDPKKGAEEVLLVLDILTKRMSVQEEEEKDNGIRGCF